LPFRHYKSRDLFASLATIAVDEKKQQKPTAPKEAEKGTPLAPSAHDLKPWYAGCELEGGAERDLEKDYRANGRKQYMSSHISY
jgi:hypothetical protein